ncbi:serine/threonine protein kinase [Aphanothece hegewaldii CCALA 016]|uniref:Serine/threonine protein kinase n=1 Tax=Aphanothece hegewaldii CCALA 016 TaxID=2107694 RepID=A0A2T1LXY3_9CHRO|nr:serine/threonine-protein kinase [Aphanothece hegewaldii]PSF37247.1 serine/threonine protein kinase [Aphanothece hegewaldii CCALA 016]
MQRSRYRTLGQIGQGQFGKVFCGIDRENGQVFALKDLDIKQFPTRKFLRELSYLVSLKHPNIISFHGIEHHQGGRYLVMDYCEGGTLRELMESGQKITLQLILKLVQDILSALVHAHRKKIIHCDIKPENILLKITSTGYIAKLSDFGIARWSEEQLQPYHSGGYTGSPAYMAPERFYGKYSAASDLYAVGILLYELLVGSRPFSGFPKDLMAAHLSQSFNLSDTIPLSLQTIIEKALRKLPQRRFTNSQEMLEAVRLAEQELLGNSSDNIFFIPSSSSSLNNFSQIIKKVYLSRKITNLSVVQNWIYWVEKNVLMVQFYYDKTDLEFFHDYKITFEDEIIKLEFSSNTVYIFTFSEESNLYTLYHFFVEQEQLKKLLTWSANQLISSIDIKGKWIAIALNYQEINIYSLQDFKFIKSTITEGKIQQIITLDQSHCLVIHQSTSEHTLFQIFNRRGNLFKAFSITLAIELVTLSKVADYEIFAIETNKPFLGLLIKLKPLKITRIPLPFKPSFVLAQSWGYILASSLGEIIVLNAQGIIQGEINLSATITAITTLNDEKILVATESNNQSCLQQLSLKKDF